MSFIEPMYAASMPKSKHATRITESGLIRVYLEQALQLVNLKDGEWVAEEKIDGHRLIVEVPARGTAPIAAWSRDGIIRLLPNHLYGALRALPQGIYDGELFVPGKRSFGVTELINGPDLAFVVFDVLELLGVSTACQSYDERRAYLAELLTRGILDTTEGPLRLSAARSVSTAGAVLDAFDRVLAKDGEGLILKRRASRYFSGKRPKGAWMKIKALRSAVLTVTGFKKSSGLIQDRGPYARVLLRDDEGVETSVKTLNDRELARFAADAPRDKTASDDPFELAWYAPALPSHPAIGRKLRIEYHEKTNDGQYREPRWDRWEEDGA